MKLTNLAFLRNSWLNTAITKQKHLGLHNFRLCYSCVLRLRPQRNLVLTLSKNFIVTFKMAAGRPKILQISNYCLEFSVLQIGKKVSKPALGVPKLSLISCQALSVPDTVTLANMDFYMKTVQTILNAVLELSKSRCLRTDDLQQFYKEESENKVATSGSAGSSYLRGTLMSLTEFIRRYMPWNQ